MKVIEVPSSKSRSRYSYIVIILSTSALGISMMQRVGSAGNTSNSLRPRKEKKLTYVLNGADDTKVILCLNSSLITM